MNAAEKILSYASDGAPAQAGREITVFPDLVALYVYSWPSDSFDCIRTAEECGTLHTENLRVFLDHRLPTKSVAQAEMQREASEYCMRHGIPCIWGTGIGHQLLIERGGVQPGGVVVHHDAHALIAGAIGALTITSQLDVILALSEGHISLRVPETVRVDLDGCLERGVYGRDVFAHLMATFGPELAEKSFLEFGGSGKLSMDSRATVCCLSPFLGAEGTVFEEDEIAQAYFKEQHMSAKIAVTADADAAYRRRVRVDLGAVRPMIACPPSPDRVYPISELSGLEVYQGLICSCAGSRLEDLKAAAEVLRNKHVSSGFRLYVSPASSAVFHRACDLGYIQTLLDAGAFLCSPSCDFCSGKQGILANGERGITTGTLNAPGRMGNIQAEVYNASAASVASAALRGRIIDPRECL